MEGGKEGGGRRGGEGRVRGRFLFCFWVVEF